MLGLEVGHVVEIFELIIEPKENGSSVTIEESILKSEQALISALEAKRSGIDDRTGKGSATELLIEREILTRHLPPEFECAKGAVVTAVDPSQQSPAIDRVIYDPSSASPLVYDEAHSIFPIESVCGLVEITMYLDSGKLREDIARMAPVKEMRRRRYLVPAGNSSVATVALEQDWLSPRSFVVGLPANPNWKPELIGQTLRELQLERGGQTHVHGLYVFGIGYFETIPIASSQEQPYRIRGWTGPDRLFRFTNSLREAFQRWPRLPPGWSVNLSSYVWGSGQVIAE